MEKTCPQRHRQQPTMSDGPGLRRMKHVYSDILEWLNDHGFKRTWKQCQTNIKDMKFSNRQTVRNPSSSGRVTCPLFSELHTFLAAMPDMPGSKVSDGEVMSSDQDEGPSVDVKLENLHEEMASRKETHKTLTGEQTEERKWDEAFHSPQCHSRMKIRRISHRCEQMVEDKSDLSLQPIEELSDKEVMSSTSSTMSDDDRRIQNWNLHETKTLIAIWSNKQILQELEHSYRKKHVQHFKAAKGPWF
ncbi:unnamed protein product [Coregonus sp. 'balchen']|nr:unnamed protein product [Coregonus sp. 'balchen']